MTKPTQAQIEAAKQAFYDRKLDEGWRWLEMSVLLPPSPPLRRLDTANRKEQVFKLARLNLPLRRLGQ